MSLRVALVHLARVGVTADVLDAEGVDPDDPQAVRDLIKALYRTALAENRIASMRQVARLQMAWAALATGDERVEGAALADLVAAALAEPPPATGQFEACLKAV